LILSLEKQLLKFIFNKVRNCWVNPEKSTSKEVLFSIQAAGLVYHRRTKRGVYHQGRHAVLVSHHASACIFLRLDDIQHYVLMICNSFGIDDIHALRRDFMASCVDVLDFQGLFVF
jgi:hypothetical protein